EAFPDLAEPEREFLISGVSPEGWRLAIGPCVGDADHPHCTNTSNDTLKNGPQDQERENDEYFGVCPTCRKSDGYLNLGRANWFVCHEHRVRWLFGENLFSTW